MIACSGLLRTALRSVGHFQIEGSLGGQRCVSVLSVKAGRNVDLRFSIKSS